MGYSKASDKRRYLRYEVLDYCLVFAASNDPVNSVIVDIGLGGIQLRSKETLPVGSICRVEIGRLHQSPIVLAGEVMHSALVDQTELVASGIRFCPEAHEERLAIAEFVHSVFQRQCDKLLL